MYKNKASSYKPVAYKRNRAFVDDYLRNNPCIDCGEGDIVVLDFDHKDKYKKFKEVSAMIWAGYSLDSIQVEIAKCEVRCANCHRRKTAKERNYYKGS